MLIKESRYVTWGVKLHLRSQIIFIGGSLDPFEGVVLDIGDYAPKGVL